MAKPDIRLKGFEGEWKPKLLSGIAKFSKGHGYSKSDLCEHGSPIILYGRLYTNYRTEIDEVDTFVEMKEGSVLSKGGEIIIPASGETPEDIACASVVKSNGIILGGDLNVLSIEEKNYNPTFTALSISYGRVHNELAKYAQGKTVVHLHNAEISKATIHYPHGIEEQQSIADYFKSLDSMIQGVTKKIASLKQMKQACLVSMFPQAGETKPRVRFKGFKGEWECSPLSTFSKKVINKNNNLEIKITLTNSAEYGIINQLDFFDHDVSNGDNIRGYYVVENDDFVYNPRVSTLAPVGPINRNQLGYAGVMSPLYYVFRVSGIDKDYLSCFFKTNLWHKFMKDNGNSGARFDRLSITDDMFVQMPILYPKSEGEQKQIASFFTSLDKQISLQEARLEKLKQIKAACLDKMFV